MPMNLPLSTRHILALFIKGFVLVLAGCGGGISTPGDSVTHQGKIVLSAPGSPYLSRNYQGIPAIAKTGSRIWAAWYGSASDRTAGEGPGNFVIAAFSDDGGKQWQESFYIVPQNADTERVFDPQLWTDPMGKLWVFYAQSGKGMINDNQISAWASIVANPLSLTPSVTGGIPLAAGVPSSPFLIDKQWHLFINYWDISTPVKPDQVGKNLYSFDWQSSTVTFVGKPENISSMASFDETTAVQLGNRLVFAQWRTTSGIYYAVSADRGVHWTPPSRFTGVMPLNCSRHVIAKHPISGRLVIVINKNQQERTDLTVAASDDDGVSWPYQYDFEPLNKVSYPSIVFSDNGDLLIVYDEDRYDTGKIKLARINESALVAGKAVATISIVSSLK